MNFTIVHELIAVPAKPVREDYIRAAQHAAARGGAQRIIIEVNRPVYVERVVEESQAPSQPEQPEDLFEIIRNSPIEELVMQKDQTLKQGIFESLHQFARKGLFPRYVLCHDIQWFVKNSGFPLVVVNHVHYLFGYIRVLVERRLEKEVILLVSNKTPLDRATDVALSIKLNKL